MKLGVYNAILHDRSLPQAIEIVRSLGLTGIELNSGGFLPATHIPKLGDVLDSDVARDEFLEQFADTGVSIAGLNCNGNPLHPKRAIGEAHAADVRRSIRLAERLGQDRVVTMSGLPGGEPGATVVNWVVNAWNSAALDVLDYQWDIAAEFWREMDRFAADHGVKIALELHPQNLVFNSADVHKLIELTNATHIGVELDASHLFWQQMDPVAVVRHLGELVVHAAAKDVRVNPEWARLNGVLDNSFRRLGPDEPRTNLGGDEWANEWPKRSAWDFVALGRGHDTEFWTEFLRAIRDVDPGMWVNIEHEDVSLGRIEGLEVASKVLLEADAALQGAR
ncbi:sugar phosphate isomerase/epimerase family protein [Leucobacter manosquensis]|uniref:Sugar phosphate isomerase/epimerase n=1 Tax=Leucobacter manosquensis TaxID=2810611 RepID=A0ABS5M674_9MICO|nr:sugar phosphate isomerase/epimerase [Leucobacter manosquensis]MBS3182695.1 sugar phosphate isomerase/epimerase [Leucobacter manosquensis]